MSPPKINSSEVDPLPSEDGALGFCDPREDNSWNGIKSWYLFFLHLVAAISLLAGVISIDEHNFQIGSGPSLFMVRDGLYQTQVTALISLALVITRLVAGSCSTLLTWRILSLLLEKRGVSLGEMTRLVDWQIPVLPWKSKSWLWTLFAITATLLMWPQAFVAPFASSSVTWLPRNKTVDSSTTATITSTGQYADYAAILYSDWRMKTVVAAAAMTGKDPLYAFESAQLPIRRYFNASQTIPDHSKINMIMPYFAVDLRWIDAFSDSRSRYAGNTEYQDVDNDFGIRTMGATAIVRDHSWDPGASIPTRPEVYNGTVLIAVKLRTLNFGDVLPDGTIASSTTPCLTADREFGKLPNVAQHQSSIVNGNQDVVAYDCYIFAEATIVAGSYRGKDCTITTFEGTPDHHATCSVQRDDANVQGHWLTSLSIDFLSEVLKYTVLLNYSQPWISNDLDKYTSGMLAMGYHAAFSGMIKTLGNDTETVAFKAATPVIAASIDKPKLYIWWSMNLALSLSAILVFVAQRGSKLKTIRDPALSALTMDLSEVTHAMGLCNAVTLSKDDHKLEKLRWKDNSNCCKLVLASARERELSDGIPLLDGRPMN
jgi:hypothetical protein